MKLFPRQAAVFIKLASTLLACALLNGAIVNPPVPSPLARFPKLTLWAWERPEQLTFLDPGNVGIAFLAGTIYLDETPRVQPRMQPLRIPPSTKLIAVVRIEVNPKANISASPEYRQQVTSAIIRAVRLPEVWALQLDFDATRSQREFYAALLRDVRQQMPGGMPLSITALASWCVGDRWLEGLPIDEAVPMMFRMGPADRLALTDAIQTGGIREPLCSTSIGLSTDEPWPSFAPNLRVYLFHPRPWDAATFISFEQRINK